MRPKYLIRKIAHKAYTLADNSYNLDPQTDGEYQLLDRVLGQAPQNSIFFDAGAAYGDWSAYVLAGRHDAQIHLFDPFPEMQERQRNRFENDTRVIRNPVGLSNKNETINFFPETYSIHSRESDGKPGTNGIRVETIRLDDYIASRGIQNVYFLKMDIEGYEPFALEGASESIGKGVFMYIQFEYGGCNIDSRTYLKDFYDRFRGTRYRIGKLHPRHIEYLPQYNRLIDNFYDCNWIAERVD
jgi:FkbM family methyltransferase